MLGIPDALLIGGAITLLVSFALLAVLFAWGRTLDD